MLVLGFGLIFIPPQGNLGKLSFGAVFVIFGLLSLLSPMMREPYANGIRLERNGFTVQRGLLGLLKQSYSYAGFLRILELPTQKKLILVFAKPYLEIHSTSSITQSYKSLSNAADDTPLVWLVLPTVNNHKFTEHFTSNIQNDEKYQQTAKQLPEIDVLKAYQAQLRQPLYQLRQRFQIPLQDFVLTLKQLATLFGGINPAHVTQIDHKDVFPAIRQQTRPAILLVLIGIFIATLGSLVVDVLGATSTLVQSIRLLALIWLSGPMVWLIFEYYKQQARVILAETALQLHQPFQIFNRTIPYRQIMLPTALENGAMALIWLKPRKIAPGDDPRPPKARLLMSLPIEDTAICLAKVVEKTQQNVIPLEYQDWTVEKHIYRRRNRRAIFRRFLLLVVLPAISFILFMIAMQIRAGLVS